MSSDAYLDKDGDLLIDHDNGTAVILYHDLLRLAIEAKNNS